MPNIQGDNVIPSVSEIPSILTTIRNPRKSRSVSIGPQSEADVYEALAHREKRRRESMSEMMKSSLASKESDNTTEISSRKPRIRSSTLENNEEMMRLGSSTHESDGLPLDMESNLQISNDASQYEEEKQEMFSKIEKPRVRYDVEVITKLIVYTGRIR